jgi:hypothetical protein
VKTELEVNEMWRRVRAELGDNSSGELEAIMDTLRWVLGENDEILEDYFD